MVSMRSNRGSRGSNSGTMVFWDMETTPPPPNFEFLDHLLASHRAMSTGLFSLCPPLKLRAHGTEALPAAAHDYIVKSKLCLQQSISCDSEQGSCWKAMIVDMLLWATDHAPGMADMVIISRVLDRSLADAIHQLHIRHYNIIVTASFPPKAMTPLREYVPPQIKMLHQMFPPSDSLLNGTKEVAVEEETLVNDEASIRATNSQPQQSQMTELCSLLMGNCRILVEEYLRKGVTEFLEGDLYANFRTRFGSKLTFKEIGFGKLDAFLQAAVPGVNFKSILVGRSWILCNRPGHALTDNAARLISAATSTPPAQQVLNYGTLTMEEVRNWLEELVASGRANHTGINLSNLGKDFEDRTGKKLNYKSLHCPNLMTLLSKFENLVRIERNQSMVHIFPRNTQSSQGARPPVPENVPVSYRPFIRPPRNCIPAVPVRPPCTSLPSVVQVSCITRSVPTAMPVPKFSCTAPNTTTMRAPTAAFVAVPRTATPEVAIAPAAGEHASEKNHLNHLPNADVAGLTGEITEKDQESEIEQTSAPSITDIHAAHKPDSYLQIFVDSKLPPDLVRDANTAVETKVEQAGGQHSLPTAVPTPGIEKGHQARNGEDGGIFAGNGKKLDYYRLTSTVQEREAIKRTFESVNRRLREEFKKRRLAYLPPVAEACNRENNTL